MRFFAALTALLTHAGLPNSSLKNPFGFSSVFRRAVPDIAARLLADRFAGLGQTRLGRECDGATAMYAVIAPQRPRPTVTLVMASSAITINQP
jgi:hypothetical protein